MEDNTQEEKANASFNLQQNDLLGPEQWKVIVDFAKERARRAELDLLNTKLECYQHTYDSVIELYAMTVTRLHKFFSCATSTSVPTKKQVYDNLCEWEYIHDKLLMEKKQRLDELTLHKEKVSQGISLAYLPAVPLPNISPPPTDVMNAMFEKVDDSQSSHGGEKWTIHSRHMQERMMMDQSYFQMGSNPHFLQSSQDYLSHLQRDVQHSQFQREATTPAKDAQLAHFQGDTARDAQQTLAVTPMFKSSGTVQSQPLTPVGSYSTLYNARATSSLATLTSLSQSSRSGTPVPISPAQIDSGNTTKKRYADVVSNGNQYPLQKPTVAAKKESPPKPRIIHLPRLLHTLWKRYPELSRTDVGSLINTVRERRGGKLSGMTIGKIYENLDQMLCNEGVPTRDTDFVIQSDFDNMSSDLDETNSSVTSEPENNN